MGGFYECLVGLVKLQTILIEVEAFVNSRPLVYVGTDLNSGFALTPADFLCLNPKSSVPCLATEDQQQDPDFLVKLSSSMKLLVTWRKGQKHLNIFWKLWFDQYVLSLCERTQKHLKTGRVQSEIQPTNGDVVLLKGSSPRGTWKLGIIEELLTSKDGEVRTATVRTASGNLLNPSPELSVPFRML